jgi:hypothetical protein
MYCGLDFFLSRVYQSLGALRTSLYCIYLVPGGFAMSAGPVKRPGDAPREGCLGREKVGEGGITCEIGALVEWSWVYKQAG